MILDGLEMDLAQRNGLRLLLYALHLRFTRPLLLPTAYSAAYRSELPANDLLSTLLRLPSGSAHGPALQD